MKVKIFEFDNGPERLASVTEEINEFLGDDLDVVRVLQSSSKSAGAYPVDTILTIFYERQSSRGLAMDGM